MNSAIQALLIGLRTTISNIRANKQTFLISVMTIAISIGILGLFLIVFFNLNGLLTSWNQHVQLVIYLEDDISSSQKGDLEDLFKSTSKVQLGFHIALRLVFLVFRGGSKLKNISFTKGKPLFLKSHSFDLGALFSSKMTQFGLQNRSQISKKSIQKLSRKNNQNLSPK